MSAIQRIDWFTAFQRNSLTVLLLAIAGCNESARPIPATDFNSSIWLLAAGTDRPIDGDTISCRPMLMELTVTETSVTLGTRVFPCNEAWNSFDALKLERSGNALLRDGENVGTMIDHRLEIRLANENRSILWDLDILDAPYTERTETDEFKARPELRDDTAPFATNVSVVGTEDIPVKGFAHCARLPEENIFLQHLSSPSGGKLAYFDPKTGEFRFDPDKDFFGQTSFHYKVYAGDWPQSTAQAHITVVGTQDPPRALDTYVSASEDSPTLILPNVIDADGDEVTAQVVDPPQHGKVETTFGSFVYTPEANYNGKDNFTYIASDGFAQSNVATVEVTVIKANDPPQAIDQEIMVTAGSDTPFTLSAIDSDSPITGYEILSFPQSGYINGLEPNLVYTPPFWVTNGVTELTFRAGDQSSDSGPGKIRFVISPGTHECELLTTFWNGPKVPVLNDGSWIYYTSTVNSGMSYLGATNGTYAGTNLLLEQTPEVSGFDNNVGASRHTTFFKQGSLLFFSSTDKTQGNFYLYQTDTLVSAKLPLSISPPEVGITAEPSVGDAFIDGPSTYLSLSWPRTATECICQVWRIDEGIIDQAALVHTLPPANGPCMGFWSLTNAQYMFAGSKLLKFVGMQNAPVILKDLGNAQPQPWMVVVGDKLFFQTRTDVGNETRIELWVTDGTEIGTKSIKELETAFLEFNIFSPIAFADKLYFAHRKSLWSSDGTEAGTTVVTTIPVTNIIGDGAIGTISALNGKLFFLATSDVFGREPWVSDGTPAGTQLLSDIQVGPSGSASPSLNPVYFHAFNGQVLFATRGDGNNSGLWTTDGTPAGTIQLTKRQINTILGILGDKLIFQDAYFTYKMNLL